MPQFYFTVLLTSLVLYVLIALAIREENLKFYPLIDKSIMTYKTRLPSVIVFVGSRPHGRGS